jgi:hypothetical protein
MNFEHLESVGSQALVLSLLCLASCSADAAPAASTRPNQTPATPMGQSVAGIGSRAAGAPASTNVAGTKAAPVTPPIAAAGQAASPPVTPPTSSPKPMGGPTPPAMGAAGAAGGAPPAAAGPMPMPAADSEDGDASKPVFTNPDMACRQAGGGFGSSKSNFKVDDRDVIIDYPCNKHEGAPMTFILNLHGTTPVEQHFYQEGYFSAYQFVASHNLIIATPSSVVEQWGNGDDGKDAPYLMHVIDYIYTAFAKFEIKQMWVGGHSWGAFYTSQFGCKAELADKVKGLIIMSGASTLPACASKMALLNTVAEMDIGPAIDFQTLPMQHGCGTEMSAMLGNNEETFWPSCTAPFVHSKYRMLGKKHADFMDKEVVQSLVDWIKISRQMQH